MIKLTKQEWRNMRKAVVKTKQKYIDGINPDGYRCPLCVFDDILERKYSVKKLCEYCPHMIFNEIHCLKWLGKHSSFEDYEDIFISSHSKTIKAKCIARHDKFLKLIDKKIKEKKEDERRKQGI